MQNPFKNNTVEAICSTLNTTVIKLEKLQEQKRLDAAVMDSIIESATENKRAALDEADRAEKIAGNVKKLLDID